MSTPVSDPATARLAAAELVGTTVVMLGGPGLMIVGGDDIGRVGIALGFGFAYALAIGVIGAVANPMFSLALWFGKSITSRELFADWIGQFLGAVFGAAIIFGLNDTTRFTTGVNGWETSSDFGAPITGFQQLGVVIGAELVAGAIVVLVLLTAIKEHRSNTAAAAFVGVGMALVAMLLQPISGVGVNPARSLATAIFADTDPNALSQVWVFVLVPIAAAFVGLVAYLAIDDSTIDDTVFDDTALESVTDAVTGDT
jgi:aquaporin Z